MKHFIAIVIFFTMGLSGIAQLPENKISKSEYIELYKDIAIEEMIDYGIPVSITLAQGILESASGNSKLAKKANNHFGIKCHKGWTGKTFHMDDDAKNECFRKYKNVYESYKDHSIFLTTRSRYAFLFDLDITDYRGWANGLKKAGYATNPKYPQLLIKIIEDYELHKYDKQHKGSAILNEKPVAQNEAKNIKNSQNSDFKPIVIGASGREIFVNNGVKFVYAKKGDSFYKIAQDFNIYTWQVYKYNDLKKKDPINEGDILYLEAKKNKGANSYHIVNHGESLYDISQAYGIKLKKLCKYNTLDKNATLFPNQKIKLR